MTKIYDLGDPAQPALHPRLRLARARSRARPAPRRRACTGPSRSATASTSPTAPGPRACSRSSTGRSCCGQPQAPIASRRPWANLLYPQIGRLDMSPAWGGHTSFPILGLAVPHWSRTCRARARDFVLLVSESLRNECREIRQLSFMVDVTTERSRSRWHLQGAGSHRDFCRRGGRFGPHSSNESFTPDLLRPPRVHRVLQRGGARGGRARSVPSDRGRLLHPLGHGQDGQALRGGRGRPAALQGGDPDQQRRRGRPRATSTSRTGPTPGSTSWSSTGRRPRHRQLHQVSPAHEPFHRPVRDGGREHLQPALDQHEARGDAHRRGPGFWQVSA